MKLLSPARYERLGRETAAFAICFVLAELVNVAAILLYRTEWRELYTQAGWLIIVASAFYLVSILARIIATRVQRRRAP